MVFVTIDTQSMKVYEISTNNAAVTEIAAIQSGFTGINSMDVWEDGAIVHSNATCFILLILSRNRVPTGCDRGVSDGWNFFWWRQPVVWIKSC